MKFNRTIVAAILIGTATAAAAYAVYDFKNKHEGAAHQAKSDAASGALFVAQVNDDRITDADIAAAMNSGTDKAVAVDRAINKALAAQLAKQSYAKDAEAALAAVQRDVLSQLYIAKRSAALRESVTAADVQSYYDKNIDARAFAEYKISAYVTQDPKEAEQVASVVAAGGAASVSSKFQPIAEGKSLKAGELPYGLGQVAAQLKPGEYSRPLALRNGIYMLRLDESKPGAKPDLAKVSDEIKDILVAERLNNELTKTRAVASITIK